MKLRHRALLALVCALAAGALLLLGQALSAQDTLGFAPDEWTCGAADGECTIDSTVRIGPGSLSGCTNPSDGQAVFVAGAAGAATFDCRPPGGLTAAQRSQLAQSRGAAAADSFTYSGDELSFDDLDGAAHTVTIFDGACATVEGTGGPNQTIHWKEAGSLAKPICQWEADDTAAGGTGLDAGAVRTQTAAQLRAGANVTLTPSGAGATQTLTIAAGDTALTARVAAAEAFEAALKRTRALGAWTWTQGLSSAAVRAAGISLPTTAADQAITVTYVDSGATWTFPLSRLRAKAAVTTPGTQLDDANSLSDTQGGVVYRVAHDNGAGLFVATEEIAQGNLTFAVREIDVEDFARRSTTSRVPPAKLGSGARDGARYLRDDGTWATIPSGHVQHAVTLDTSGFTSGDAGAFPAWSDGLREWVEGNIDDTTYFSWRFDTSSNSWKVSPTGKLLEVLNAFTGGSWAPVAGPSATTPFVSQTLPAAKPTSLAGLTFGVQGTLGPYYSNVWAVVRIPRALSFHDERYRLALTGDTSKTFAIDAGEELTAAADATYRYYVVEVADKPAGEGWTTQALTPFEPNPSRLDLVTTMLRDMPSAAQRTAANSRKVLVYDHPTQTWQLGAPERPAAISALPSPLVAKRRYLLDAPSSIQPWYDVTPEPGGANDPARAGNVTGTEGADRWSLIRYANALTLDSQIRGQLVLTRPGSETRNPLAIRIDGVQYTLGSKLAGTYSNSYVVQAAPSWVAGTAYEIVVVLDADPHNNLPARVDVAPGDYTATGPHSLEGTPGAQYGWATRGNDELIPPGKIPHVAGRDVLAHSFRMSLVTTTHDTRWSAPYYIAPAIDLDDAGNQRGELNFSLVLTIAPTSDANMGFERNKANQSAEDRNRILSNEVHLSALRAQAAYVAKTSGPPTGALSWAEVDVFSLNTLVGEVFAAAVHNDDNEVGVFLWYDGAAGSTGAVLSGTIYAHRTTGDVGSASSFAGLSDTPASFAGDAGKSVVVNAAGTGLAFQAKPGLVSLGAPVAISSGTNNVALGVNVSEMAGATFIYVKLRPTGTIPQRLLQYLPDDFSSLGITSSLNGALRYTPNAVNVPVIGAVNAGRFISIYKKSDGSLHFTPSGSSAISNYGTVQLYTFTY